MTQNQINYQNHLEQKRANLARETETHRGNLAQEELGKSNLAETKRANLAREVETNRANLAKEAETHRSNTTVERETHRSNLANELLKGEANQEIARSNFANEGLKRQQNVITAIHNDETEKQAALDSERRVLQYQDEIAAANERAYKQRELEAALTDQKNRAQIISAGIGAVGGVIGNLAKTFGMLKSKTGGTKIK